MRTGPLRHRIVIQKPTRVKNAFDEWVDDWEDWATVWAAVEPLRGSRYFAAKQASSEVEGTVRMRYRDGVEPTMRIKFGERYLKIISVVNPSERRRELEILYKEGID